MNIEVHITGNVGPRGSRLELAYIRLSKAKVVRTDEIDTDRLLAHFDKDGHLVATPFEGQDSSMMARLAEADCLLVRPPNAPAAKKGERAEIIPLDVTGGGGSGLF